MSTTQKQPGELFAGTLYVSMLDDATGTFQPFFMVETDKLEIKTPSTQLQAVSKSRENYGQVHTSARVPKPTEFAVTFTEVNHKMMAMKLSGVIEAINSATAALSDKSITLAGLDEWVEIGYDNLVEAGFVAKSSDGTTTYTKGTDYELNPRLGMIRPLTGGAIVAKTAIKLTGSVAAVTGTRILGGKKYQHQFRARLDGVNIVTQEDAVVDIALAVVSSEDAHDFFDDKLQTIALKGQLVVPKGAKAAFSVTYPAQA